MTGPTTMHELSPGLAGVPAAKSSISFVNGQTGLLEYRGIRIEELPRHSSFRRPRICCSTVSFRPGRTGPVDGRYDTPSSAGW